MIYLTLFLEFFKIGLFTFGGGYAMIPLIKETVLHYGWLTELQFHDFLGVCESTPGPIAINMATYIGSTQAGVLGAFCATIGVILPSFIIILLVATLLKKVYRHPVVQGFLKGVKPVIVGLISVAGLQLLLSIIGVENLKNASFNIVPVVTFAIVGLVYCLVRYVFKRKFNNIFFILFSAVVGVLVSVIFCYI